MCFDHLWVSALTTFYGTEKTLSLDVRAMLVYGQRDMNVENCLQLYSLAKQQWLVHHQSLGASQLWFWIVYSTRHAFCSRKQDFNPVRKWLLLPKPLCHPIMAYITLLVIITGYWVGYWWPPLYSILHSTFQSSESWPAWEKLTGQHQLAFSRSCDQSSCRLQQ